MRKPARQPYQPAAPSSTDWSEILANPQDIWIDVFETGRLKISNKYFLNMKHPEAMGLEEEILTVPVYCYLITHGEHGSFLVDAGLDRSFQEDTHGNIRGPLRKIFWPLESYQQKGQDVETQLKEKDVAINAVFFTHLHSDHASGIQHLPKDIRVVVGRNEPDFCFGPLYYQDNFAGVDTVYELDFDSAPYLPPLGRCIDIFGDGSFWAIDTPGHRKGHVSYLVNGKWRAVLITGDACDIKLNFDLGIGPGFGSHDSRAAQKSLLRLRAFARVYPQVSVFYGHEIT